MGACCARLGMAILCHTGDETSVEFLGSRVSNELGSPLRLRRALRAGVRVIAAHCASEGSARDDAGEWRPCVELLFEMMAEPAWRDLLFADISAMTIFKRLHALVLPLERPALFSQLVYGSDYPVPALGGRIVGTVPQPLALRHGGAFGAQLVTMGLVDAAQCAQLHEVFQYNPMLFDLVLKLTVRHPKTGTQLPAALFGAHPLLPPLGEDRGAET